MKPIIIYTQPYCKKSDNAKKILTFHQLYFTERDTTEVEVKREMIERTGGKALTPQIFIDNHYIGGYEELCNLYKKNNVKKSG